MLPIVLLLLAASAALPDQGDALARTARAAAYRYENLLRDRAPYYSGAVGGGCDEIVGRFCLRFGSGAAEEAPAAPEHPDVTSTRSRVIRAYRAWVSAEPGDEEAVGGLIRYLIEDNRAAEAVVAARAHAALSSGHEGLLLLGLALHATGAAPEAEAAFDSARSLAGSTDRGMLDDVSVLLDPPERSRYRELPPEARASYNNRFWAFSDPSLLLPGNERRAAHYARHAWIRILARGPRARGSVPWGDDHAEIILRYGVPTGREKVRRPPFRLDWQERSVSTYGPGSVSLVPAGLLTEGIPPAPSPGARPVLERDSAVSSYRPFRLGRLKALRLQMTRIVSRNGWILRVDGMLVPDTAFPGPAPAPGALLTVFDTLGGEIARTPMTMASEGPGLVVRSELPLPAGTYVYQAEVVDTATGVAGRALHRVVLPGDGLSVSDPVVGWPVDDPSGTSRRGLSPLPEAVLDVGREVMLWSSVGGLTRVDGASRYAVEWWLERRDRGSPLGRVVRWLGRALGLGEASAPVRVRWDAETDLEGPVPIVFAVRLEGMDPGLYRLMLRVTDRVSGEAATSCRELLLEAAGSGVRALADDPDRS